MSELALKRVSPDGPEWTQLLAEHNNLIFHQPVWAQVVEEGFGGETCCLVLEIDGRVRGGMLGFIHRVLWFRFLLFNFPYGGVIGHAPESGQLACLLLEYARARRIARIRLTDSPGLEPVPPAGFHVVPNTTHLLEIKGRGYEEIWMGYKKKIRRDVRKAEKNGVIVVGAESEKDINDFYHLYLDSMYRNQVVPKYSLKLVNALYHHVISAGLGTLLLARREGRAIAGMLVVDSDSMSHYLLAGSRTEDLKYGPNDLLISEAIRRAADKGFDYFDFLPSGPGDTALIRFKTKWGAVSNSAATLDLVARPFSMALFNQASRLANTRPARLILRTIRGNRRK